MQHDVEPHAESEKPGVADQAPLVDQGFGKTDRLERLWAPYRMDYIAKRIDERAQEDGSTAELAEEERSHRPKDPFLEVPKLSDEEGLIVARGETVFCVLNLFPYNSGHMMVIPYRKVANLEDLTFEESSELMAFAQTAIKVLKDVSQPDAINVGFNLGKASGGSIGDHLHMHIVPRWAGDANFMTVLDGTKVLPQLLKDTRRVLARAWSEREDASGEDASGATDA